MNYLKLILSIFLLISTSVLANQASEQAKLKGLADMIGVKTDALQFIDENLKPLSAKAFLELTGEKRSFDIHKQADVVILAIQPVKSGTSSTQNQDKKQHTAAGNKAFPPFSLTASSGKTLTLEDFKGKPTLMSFYFSTCIPCIQEVPVLNQLKNKLESDINFIAITYENSTTSADFMKKYAFEWDVLFDAEALIERVGIPVYPAFVLLDTKGEAIATHVGNKGNTLDSLQAWMRKSGLAI